MKSLLALACIFSIAAVPAAAQMRSRSGANRQRASAADPSANAMILSGKVVVGDGGALTQSTAIQTICKGQKRTETHSDGHGNFSFQFGTANRFVEQGFDAEAEGPSRSGQRRDLQGCALQASLAGFTSDVIELDGRIPQSGSVDIGRIVLHRLQGAEGLTISATTAQAPGPARKAWEKARNRYRTASRRKRRNHFRRPSGSTRSSPLPGSSWEKCSCGEMILPRPCIPSSSQLRATRNTSIPISA